MGEFVFKRQCGRCPAVEEVPVTIEDIKKGVNPEKDRSRALKVSLGGEEILFHSYLCSACHDICMRYVEHIAKELSKKSATRTRSTDEGPELMVEDE